MDPGRWHHANGGWTFPVPRAPRRRCPLRVSDVRKIALFVTLRPLRAHHRTSLSLERKWPLCSIGCGFREAQMPMLATVNAPSYRARKPRTEFDPGKTVRHDSSRAVTIRHAPSHAPSRFVTRWRIQAPESEPIRAQPTQRKHWPAQGTNCQCWVFHNRSRAQSTPARMHLILNGQRETACLWGDCTPRFAGSGVGRVVKKGFNASSSNVG